MKDDYPESVHRIGSEYYETSDYSHGHSGTNDYSNSGLDIHKVEDGSGNQITCAWDSEWTEVSPGLMTRRENRQKSVRIYPSACPVRILFRSWSEHGSYDGYRSSGQSSKHYWVRYEGTVRNTPTGLPSHASSEDVSTAGSAASETDKSENAPDKSRRENQRVREFIPYVPLTPTGSPPSPLAIPGFKTGRWIHESQTGDVYTANREEDDQAVFLFVRRPETERDASAQTQYARDLGVLRKLHHSGILAYVDSGKERGRSWVATESLKDFLSIERVRLLEGGTISVALTLRFSLAFLDGLAYMHAKGFVHGNITSAQILVRGAITSSSPSTLVGSCLSSYLSEDPPEAGEDANSVFPESVLGDVRFMAPEQIGNSSCTSQAGDVFSAAAVIYLLLTGQHVFDLTQEVHAAQVLRFLEGAPTPIRELKPDLSPPLAIAIDKALSTRPEDRFENARLMCDFLIDAAYKSIGSMRTNLWDAADTSELLSSLAYLKAAIICPKCDKMTLRELRYCRHCKSTAI